MEKETKVKIGLWIVILVLFALGIYLMTPIYENIIMNMGGSQ